MTENQKKYNDAVDKITGIFIKELTPALTSMSDEEKKEGMNCVIFVFSAQEDDDKVKHGTAMLGNHLNLVTMLSKVRQDDNNLDRVIKMSGMTSNPIFDILNIVRDAKKEEEKEKTEYEAKTEKE